MTFRKNLFIAAIALVAFSPQIGETSGGAPLPQNEWGFKGVFSKFDQAALKRGAKVAVEVCMACHSIKYIKFDALKKIGLNETEIAELAQAQGKTKVDRMIGALDPQTAKESYGVVPPDLSLITKARKGYEDYTMGVLNGYLSDEEHKQVDAAWADKQLSESEIKELAEALHLNPHQPEKVQEVIQRISNGENFNKYFPGHFFAMPQPLQDGQVTYADGTDPNLKQLSHDVVTFLAWAAEPTLEERRSLGIKVMLYLVVLTALFYATKRRIWGRLKDGGH